MHFLLNKPLAVLLIYLTLILKSYDAEVVGKVAMDHINYCPRDTIKMFIIEPKNSIIVLGKNTPVYSSSSVPTCRVALGLSSTADDQHLMVKFESFYINECDITINILQFSSATFEEKGEEMVTLVCNQKSPDFLIAKKNHRLLITLTRPDVSARNYQFRLNISITGNPPDEGLGTSVVAIVGVGLLLVLCLLVCLLTKYAVHLKKVFMEKRAERAIDQVTGFCRSSTGDLDAAHSHLAESHLHLVEPSSRERPHTAGGVQIIYQSRADAENDESTQPFKRPTAPPQAKLLSPSTIEPEELPPSYEEALNMPMPTAATNKTEPVYANVPEK